MMMNKRQKLAIPKTMVEWLMDIVGYLALSVMLGLLLINWRDLPNEVPAHFGSSGNVDRWGSKMELLILPGIGIAMHFFLMIFERFPETHNYPVRLNDTNIEAFYTNSRQTLNYMRNMINLLFAYIVYRSIAIAFGDAATIGWPFFGIMMALLGVLIWKIVKMRRIQ